MTQITPEVVSLGNATSLDTHGPVGKLVVQTLWGYSGSDSPYPAAWGYVLTLAENSSMAAQLALTGSGVMERFYGGQPSAWTGWTTLLGRANEKALTPTSAISKGNCTVTTVGRIAIVHIDELHVASDLTDSGDHKALFTGFPGVATDATRYFTLDNIINTSTAGSVRMVVKNDTGSISAHWTTIKAGVNYSGTAVMLLQ